MRRLLRRSWHSLPARQLRLPGSSDVTSTGAFTWSIPREGNHQTKHLLMCSIWFVNHRLASPVYQNPGLGDAARWVNRAALSPAASAAAFAAAAFAAAAVAARAELEVAVSKTSRKNA